jgi:hypothetical protein
MDLLHLIERRVISEGLAGFDHDGLPLDPVVGVRGVPDRVVDLPRPAVVDALRGVADESLGAEILRIPAR